MTEEERYAIRRCPYINATAVSREELISSRPWTSSGKCEHERIFPTERAYQWAHAVKVRTHNLVSGKTKGAEQHKIVAGRCDTEGIWSNTGCSLRDTLPVRRSWARRHSEGQASSRVVSIGNPEARVRAAVRLLAEHGGDAAVVVEASGASRESVLAVCSALAEMKPPVPSEWLQTSFPHDGGFRHDGGFEVYLFPAAGASIECKPIQLFSARRARVALKAPPADAILMLVAEWRRQNLLARADEQTAVKAGLSAANEGVGLNEDPLAFHPWIVPDLLLRK